MASIELMNVGLTFRVRRLGRVSLKDALVKSMLRQSVNPIIEVRALQNVNLTVQRGERLGIIGHNGAGKSTMLRMLAGVYPPTSGERRVTGRISSLFDISLGFDMDSNGWDNIAFRGYFQGETPKTIRDKTGEIAEFSELGDALNMPLRYYSAGMSVRLAFAIATAVEPEILLIDEVLSAGDAAFQVKACERMSRLIEQADAIVMVSHDLSAIHRSCNRTAWLDGGRIRRIGSTAAVVAEYEEHMADRARLAA
jgi:lipopolysaccharide transport system ATP-binding protein